MARGKKKKNQVFPDKGKEETVHAGEIGAFDEEVGSNANRGREGSVGSDSVL